MRSTPFKPGLRYLAEGGQETELMYGYGFNLPEFALFPLLDNSAAVERLTAMYEAVLEVAVRHKLGVLLGGLDYRASPDWAELLGYEAATLNEYQQRAIKFLRDVAAPYRPQVPDILLSGIVGPQGDAYQRNLLVTAASAEAYHSVQMTNLAEAGVDVVQAMTFTNLDEAVGVIRAARNHGLPIVMSMMPEGPHLVGGRSSLSDVITYLDDQTGGYALFYGLNCAHPAEFEPLLASLTNRPERLGLIRPNASAKEKVELCQIGHLERGDPADLAVRMGALERRFPEIIVWGGCCGTWSEHLDCMAVQLSSTRH
jgi:homocysteine S-methyltransferase